MPVVRHGGEMAVDRPLCRGEAIDPVAAQLAQHRELRAARLELGDDSRDEHDRTTVNRRAGGRALRAGSAEPTKRADRVRIVPRVRGTLIEAARAAARTRDTFLAPTTTESAPAAAPTAPHSPSPTRSSPSPTRSSSPSGACCRRARSTSTPAATATPGATGPHHPTARRQARAPRLLSHAARSAGDDLNQIFSSQTTSGNASFRPSGGSPVRIRVLRLCRPPSSPSHRSAFTLAAAPVAWRGIEPEGSRVSLKRARSPKPSGSIMAPQTRAAVWCLATGLRTAGALVGAR